MLPSHGGKLVKPFSLSRQTASLGAMAVERRDRRPSRISQILFQPLVSGHWLLTRLSFCQDHQPSTLTLQVTMGRKISGGRRKMEEEEDDALRDPFLEQTLKIPQDFISEMKEAFRYFDKVQNTG